MKDEMKYKKNLKQKGFNLAGMLLILAVVAAIMYLGVGYWQAQNRNARIDKVTWQVQQILNADAAYYVANGIWTNSIAQLQSGNYLPPAAANVINAGSIGLRYSTGIPAATSFPAPPNPQNLSQASLYIMFQYTTSGTVANIAEANVIASRLPYGFTSQALTPAAGIPVSPTANPCAIGNQCFIYAAIPPPGQNLNNATAVNFAGLYHHGGCIPVPTCPSNSTGTALTPSVIVVPVSFSGMNDGTNVYPITSFTAYATGGANVNPPDCSNAPGYAASYSTSSLPPYAGNICINGNATDVSKYWRACIKVVTQRGDITTTQTSANNAWGQSMTIAAFTRCAIIIPPPPAVPGPTGESAGSDFTIYSN